MKKFIAIALLSAGAQAGNYVSLQVMQSTISGACGPMQDTVNDNAAAIYAAGNFQSVSTSCSEKDIGGRIAFGENINKQWAIELGYQDAGEVLMDIKGDGKKIAEISLGLTAADIALTFRTPVFADVYFTARAGAAHWNIKLEDSVTNVPFKDSGTTAEYGIGAEWMWLTAGYNVISKVGFEGDETRDVKQISIGGKFKF